MRASNASTKSTGVDGGNRKTLDPKISFTRVNASNGKLFRDYDCRSEGVGREPSRFWTLSILRNPSCNKLKFSERWKPIPPNWRNKSTLGLPNRRFESFTCSAISLRKARRLTPHPRRFRKVHSRLRIFFSWCFTRRNSDSDSPLFQRRTVQNGVKIASQTIGPHRSSSR